MQPDFQIDVDPVRSLVHIRLAGFFNDAAMKRFLATRASAFQALRCGRNEHLSLTDLRDMKIQAQDMVARWGHVLADPAYRSRRLAFVVATSLVRTQLQRAIGTRDARCFTDRDEAQRWVLAAVAPASIAA